MRRLLLLILTVTAACAGPAAGTMRFKTQPPIWKVDDMRPLDRAPAERIYNRTLYHTDGFFVRRLTRAMDFASVGRALDVNSIDEVPDSSWFTNRIGIRDVPLDELRRSANTDESPIKHLPWQITGGKVGGLSLGFIFEDARKQKYLLKFDHIKRPEMETAAHIIGHRLLFAAGYNVPQDYLEYIDPKDLQVSPKASNKDVFGNKTPMTQAMVDRALENVFKTSEGKIRVLVSKFIEGKPIGPYAREGTRPDDPNDRIVHERRRTIRGQVALFSWINHTDIQEDNSLDAYVNVPGSKEKGYVVHYLIDFGKAFGVVNVSNNWTTGGYTFRVDAGMALLSLFSLGLWERPWDNVKDPKLVGVGVFEASQFDPSEWRTNSPYWPYADADQYDGFWGAKIAMRFTRAHVEAAVDEAQLTDPRARTYMVDTLMARQAKVARYWFSRVSPLDRFTVVAAGSADASLCFDDLAVLYGIERGTARYDLAVFDRAGAPIPTSAQISPTGGRLCVTVPLGSTSDRYTIVRIAARRGARELPAVKVHVAHLPSGVLEVIGLRRD